MPRTPHLSPQRSDGCIKQNSSERESDEYKNSEVGQQLRAVIKNVMAHLVRHHRADLWHGALLEQIIVQRDARCAENSGDIRAYTRRLPRGIHLKDLFYRDLIRPRHRENGLADFGLCKRFIRIEERLNEYRRDEEQNKRENDSDDRPQIHHVFGARRNTAYSTMKKIVPPMSVMPRPINCSRNHAGKLCVASPY